jgi:hypothetical protein
VIGQATAAMFVRVELRDLCGWSCETCADGRLEPEKGRCGFEGFARGEISAKEGCWSTVSVQCSV